jgi:hypothetical protein
MSGADFEAKAPEAYGADDAAAAGDGQDVWVELAAADDAPDGTVVGRDPVTGEETGFVSIPVEDKARRLGWKPRGEYRGNAAQWVDAETFVRRGEEILPIVQANNRQLERALEKANAQIAEMRGTFEDFRDHHAGTEQRAYQRALHDWLEEAAQAGDVEGVKAATKEIASLQHASEAWPGQERGPLDRGVFDAFVADNPWFEAEPIMRGAAIELAERLHADGLTEPGAQLKEVAQRIRSEFAHRFENPRRREAAAVEGAPGPLRRTRGAYADLPAEAKAACDRFVKQGLLTREQFVKEYQWR